MKKDFIIMGLILSFASFSAMAGGQYEIIGNSCWKCDGGSFKAGQIECLPERTARLYEVDMSKCSGSKAGTLNSLSSSNLDRTYSPSVDQINAIQKQINSLQRQLSNLKNNSL